mmetsp:Transcript_34016/g.78022  ORF Transcript_34016/g.78022 Transcript_34016/m.78022 type:complete len:163 (-) Transcript_34016:743-1231(-)
MAARLGDVKEAATSLVGTVVPRLEAKAAATVVARAAWLLLAPPLAHGLLTGPWDWPVGEVQEVAEGLVPPKPEAALPVELKVLQGSLGRLRKTFQGTPPALGSQTAAPSDWSLATAVLLHLAYRPPTPQPVHWTKGAAASAFHSGLGFAGTSRSPAQLCLRI